MLVELSELSCARPAMSSSVINTGANYTGHCSDYQLNFIHISTDCHFYVSDVPSRVVLFILISKKNPCASTPYLCGSR